MPLSWLHFIYGLASIRREHHRNILRINEAHRMNKIEDADYRSWRRDQETLAGYGK